MSEQPTKGSVAGLAEHDVVVVGAGFAGMLMLHRLRQLGLSALVLEAGSDVGGTWYWNRYPGARCDIPTTDYCFSFDPDLEQAWTWSEKYATQPEILRYAQFVAERYALKSDIRFKTRLATTRWDEAAGRWQLRTEQGQTLSASTWSWPAAACRCPRRRSSRVPISFRARSISPAAGRTRAWTSAASGSP